MNEINSLFLCHFQNWFVESVFSRYSSSFKNYECQNIHQRAIIVTLELKENEQACDDFKNDLDKVTSHFSSMLNLKRFARKLVQVSC